MKLAVVGSGYVGTTVAACLADLGHDVLVIDTDPDVVDAVAAGRSPIHEPELDALVERWAGERLRASTSYVGLEDRDATFLCLPTPARDDGSIDLSAFGSAVPRIAERLSTSEEAHVVVTKSTVTPGTTESVVAEAIDDVDGCALGEDVAVAANPEFLREGSAVDDFMDPDKIVVGADGDLPLATLREVYASFREDGVPYVETGIREAETIKYANNAMLASKVSLVNDIGNVCEELDVDTYEVMDAVGLDHRIASSFLRSGLGWGGSCFPKDVDALRSVARGEGYEPAMLDAAVAVNDRQPGRMVSLLERHVDPGDATVAVLGLAFKPGTDDVRNSRGIRLVDELVDVGATVVAHDPVAIENAETIRPEIDYAETVAEALDGAGAAMVATGWPAYDDLDVSPMDRSVVIDGRRIAIDEDAVEVYEGLCW